MDKWKKLLVALNNQIDSKELARAVKDDKWEGEYEPSDDGVLNMIEQTTSLLSHESAVANSKVIEDVRQDIYPLIKKNSLEWAEGKLKPILDKLGIDYKDKEYAIDGLKDMDMAIDTLMAGTSDEDTKKVILSLRDDLEKSNKLVSLKDDEHKSELDQKISELKAEHSSKDLLRKFREDATKLPWADAYSDADLRDAILDKKYEKIAAKAHLTLSEEGEILVFQKDMPDKELYEGTKKVLFHDLLNPEIANYLKKSDPVKTVIPGVITETNDNLNQKQTDMRGQRAKFGMG